MPKTGESQTRVTVSGRKSWDLKFKKIVQVQPQQYEDCDTFGDCWVILLFP